jgi:glutaredoxin
MICPMMRRPMILLAVVCGALGALGGCEEASAVEPPFEVRGEAEGLHLTWFDDEGRSQHAERRSQIPEDRRALVRVDDLRLAPEDRLDDPDHVYVADLRRPGSDGAYPVRRVLREHFEEEISRASPSAAVEQAEAPLAAEPAPPANAEVVIYGASWCGACRSAAAFLREREVPFVERDVQREPGAREAMARAARAAGVSPTGIPVIDFRGRIIQGFDRGALERAIAETRAPI